MVGGPFIFPRSGSRTRFPIRLPRLKRDEVLHRLTEKLPTHVGYHADQLVGQQCLSYWDSCRIIVREHVEPLRWRRRNGWSPIGNLITSPNHVDGLGLRGLRTDARLLRFLLCFEAVKDEVLNKKRRRSATWKKCTGPLTLTRRHAHDSLNFSLLFMIQPSHSRFKHF